MIIRVIAHNIRADVCCTAAIKVYWVIEAVTRVSSTLIDSYKCFMVITITLILGNPQLRSDHRAESRGEEKDNNPEGMRG